MNCCKRLTKILVISDEKLLALAGDVDTYLYIIFLRMVTYLMIIFMIVDCSILLPIYKIKGTTAHDYYNTTANYSVLSDVMEFSIGNVITQKKYTILSLIITVINIILVIGVIARFRRKVV